MIEIKILPVRIFASDPNPTHERWELVIDNQTVIVVQGPMRSRGSTLYHFCNLIGDEFGKSVYQEISVEQIYKVAEEVRQAVIRSFTEGRTVRFEK